MIGFDLVLFLLVLLSKWLYLRRAWRQTKTIAAIRCSVYQSVREYRVMLVGVCVDVCFVVSVISFHGDIGIGRLKTHSYTEKDRHNNHRNINTNAMWLRKTEKKSVDPMQELKNPKNYIRTNSIALVLFRKSLK